MTAATAASPRSAARRTRERWDASPSTSSNRRRNGGRRCRTSPCSSSAPRAPPWLRRRARSPTARSRSYSRTTRCSARSTGAGGDATRPPTSSPSRAANGRSSATWCSPTRRWRAKPASRARALPIISPISSRTACCISSVTTTRRRTRPKRWRRWSGARSPASASPTPIAARAPMAEASEDRSAGDNEGPFERIINWLRHLGRRNGEPSLREELEELIEEHQEEAPIDPHERRLLINILKLHELTAANVMVPRVDIVAMPVDTSFADAARQMAEHGHSRVPVYRETLDDVIGIVHFKDLLPYAVDGRAVPLAEIVRKVLFAAPSMPVLDLLLQMRLSRVHMALVVDEFGGIDGLVTIEDVIEESAGEIEDEHDDADRPKLIERGDGTAIADARTPIEVLEERTRSEEHT